MHIFFLNIFTRFFPLFFVPHIQSEEGMQEAAARNYHTATVYFRVLESMVPRLTSRVHAVSTTVTLRNTQKYQCEDNSYLYSRALALLTHSTSCIPRLLPHSHSYPQSHYHPHSYLILTSTIIPHYHTLMISPPLPLPNDRTESQLRSLSHSAELASLGKSCT